MSGLGKGCIFLAALITVLCLAFMVTGYLQAPTSRLGFDPGFHSGVSSYLLPMLIVIVVALLSLIFWPKRH